MLIFTSMVSHASEDGISNPGEWNFGDNDKIPIIKPKSPLITGRFANNPWLFDISNQYEDFGESEALASSKKIRQFSQNPWEFNVSDQYANHDIAISHSLSNLWNEGTFVTRLQSLFRNTNSVGSPAKQAYAYSVDFFLQTGNYYGFSAGAPYMLTNPILADQINPGKPNIFIPTNEVHVLSQAFLQFTLPNRLQITGGRISMDTPWIKTTTNSPVTNATFLGGLVDIEINESLYLTGLYVNAYKGVAQNSFAHNSMYTLVDSDDIHPDPNNDAKLDMTLGFGIEYSPTETIKSQVWGYVFKNYVSMAYADAKKEYVIDEQQTMFFDAQGSIQSDFLSGQSIVAKLDLGHQGVRC